VIGQTSHTNNSKCSYAGSDKVANVALPQSSDGESHTQHDPMMLNYSSAFKPSQHLPSSGSANLGTSQGKEGVNSNRDDSALGGREHASGVIITQFAPKI
jgi:hypothetical protein